MMIRTFLEGREATVVLYIRHLMANGSFRPLTTFFFISLGVIWGLWTGNMNLLHASAVLGFSALILLAAAYHRDQKTANRSFEVQLEAVRALVQNSAEMSAAVATSRSDNQERSMHAQDVSIAHITTNTDKDTP